MGGLWLTRDVNRDGGVRSACSTYSSPSSTVLFGYYNPRCPSVFEMLVSPVAHYFLPKGSILLFARDALLASQPVAGWILLVITDDARQ